MGLRVEFHEIETFIQVNKKNKIRTVLENMNISQNLETQKFNGNKFYFFQNYAFH